MTYNFSQEELNEMHDWSAKAEQLVRLGMMPVAKLPYIKRALKLVRQDAFLPLIIRKPFYEFIEELLELGLGEAGIYRLIRNKVAANRNDSVSNRYVPEELDMNEEKSDYEGAAIRREISNRRLGHNPRITLPDESKPGERAITGREQSLQPGFVRKLRPLFKKRVAEELEEKTKSKFAKNMSHETDRDGLVAATASTSGMKEEFKKLLRPNFYKDEKHKENDTETKKIADKAHSKAKITEERDADERAGDREDRRLKAKKKQFDSDRATGKTKPSEEEKAWLDWNKTHQHEEVELEEGNKENKEKKNKLVRDVGIEIETHGGDANYAGPKGELLRTGRKQFRMGNQKFINWATGHVKEEFKKLLRPNFYKDEKHKENDTQTKKIADKAHSVAKVTEGVVKKANKKARRDFEDKEGAKARKETLKSPASSAENVRSARGGNWVGGTTLGWRTRIMKNVKAHIAKEKDGKYQPPVAEGAIGDFIATMRAAHTPLAGKKKSEPTSKGVSMGTRGGIKSPKDFKVASKERKTVSDEFIPEEGRRASDNPMIKRASDLWKKTNPTDKISAIAKAHRDFDGRTTPEPKVDKPMPTGKAVQLKLNMDMIMSGNLLDEDVNYRKTPQGMLQTLANMVRLKKRSGGKISTNDRKIASKARNELRRRKYFGEGLDTAFLDLADALADEGVFLNEEQLMELHKDTYKSYIGRAIDDRDDKMLNFHTHSSAGRTKKAEQEVRGIERRNKGIAHAVSRLHTPHPDSVGVGGRETEGGETKKAPKKVKPSKSSWYKSADDALDTSDVDTKKRVLKNSFQAFAEQDASAIYRAEMAKRKAKHDQADKEKDDILADVKAQIDKETQKKMTKGRELMIKDAQKKTP